MYSLYAESQNIIGYGCFGRSEEKGAWHELVGRETCFLKSTKAAFLSLLIVLQCIALAWFWMIIKVAIHVISGGEAEDSRSDDEEG